MADNITLKGKLMYEREDMLLFIKMLEADMLFPKGRDFVVPRVFWNGGEVYGCWEGYCH